MKFHKHMKEITRGVQCWGKSGEPWPRTREGKLSILGRLQDKAGTLFRDQLRGSGGWGGGGDRAQRLGPDRHPPRGSQQGPQQGCLFHKLSVCSGPSGPVTHTLSESSTGPHAAPKDR